MKVVIIGAGKVGKKIADHLAPEDHDITIVDTDPSRINTIINNQDVMCIQGNGAIRDIQLEAGVDTADVVVTTTPYDEVNMLSCLLAKKLGAKSCIARVRSPWYYKQLQYIKDELGLTMAINPESYAASEIARTLILPEATQVESFAHGKVELIQYKIPETSYLIDTTLSNLYKKLKVKILICAIERNGSVIIPDGSTSICSGDRINFICSHKEAEAFFNRILASRNKIKSVMMVGGGRVCYYLTKKLTHLGLDIKIIEKDPKRCLELSELLSDVTIINADGSDHNILKEEGIEMVDAFVALTGIDEENMITALYAKSKNVSKVIAKVTRGSYVALSDHIGLDTIVSPKQLAADNILAYIRARKNSENSSNIETIYKLVNDKIEALEFNVKDETEYTNKKLSSLKIKKNILIGSIVRNGIPITPGGDDMIMTGDSVIVVTTENTLHNLSEIFDN